jgi:hypothetical protein
MAYTQKPGRGNGLKTGGGLPSNLNANAIGNTDGYNPATSPLDNLVNKGGYEKTIDRTKDLLILRGGDKKEISRARIGSPEAEEMVRSYEAKKSDTESRRKRNLDFLQSKVETVKATKK